MRECRIILNDKPADPGADARPDRQANVLELDLSVQGLLNQGAVPVLVPVQVDQKWERDDQDQKEHDPDADPDQHFHQTPPLKWFRSIGMRAKWVNGRR